MVTVYGADACPAGWLAVGLRDGRFAQVRLITTLRSLLVEAEAETETEAATEADGVAVIAVDMPLGLLDSGWRRADREAAALLGPRRGSVFPVPPGAVWQEAEYDGARRRCRELTGAGLSRQTWALAPKLREANACIAEPGGDRLFEAHPEVSFRALAGGTPLLARKKSWAGQMARRSLLAAAGIVLPDDLGDAGSSPPDDVLDAAAAAWTAHRIARGRAHSLPDPPEHDADGRPIAIWY
ncbi:hypothetical protein SSP35_01_08030 [Streptomyces sp. NBRC 110611]|uniref:DUF429 domain-containing protein n=1 Tax=Streptomyces sp. NBRC 110611 TaxID=1621259 RepID=UPI00082E497B|nr:DUF429 domain-containing protein [Streptomyces sp. NBRC 110611]GAU65461.1 hypothetical protein SSP35_01_08030 [Streptomyces sp. NBRC 110611]